MLQIVLLNTELSKFVLVKRVSIFILKQ